MLKKLKAILGDESKKYLKTLGSQIKKINSYADEYGALDITDFPKKTEEFKERLSKGETLNDLLPEAFALVREAADRTLGERHYDVQLIGGIVMHNGRIAEMRTGEGKTLVATLPAYLNALTGDGVHVVTVNDYLSRRDAVWMGQVYNLLGLSVGIMNSQTVSYLYKEAENKDADRDIKGSFQVMHEFLQPCSRQEAYEADITYGTNNEYGFDYLRDNLAQTIETVTQKKHNFCIIDEIDSILIDEARTPLIISGEASESEDLYKKFASIANTLKPEVDYTLDEKLRAIQLTDEGISRAEDLLGIENIYTEKGIKYVHHLETAVRAKAIFIKDKDYVVQNGEVLIVDPHTGRLQPGRRWSQGLHQAVEAKEGANIQKESKTIASITYQNYFKMYNKLSGMTGTARTSSEEFLKVYALDVIEIPTNKPIARLDLPDLIFKTEKGKLQAIARKVKELQEKGQPVLVGTASIEKNELVSSYFKQAGVAHQILNAKNHEQEGLITAQAGAKGAVTIATNMAGRGVDIKLGGADSSKEEQEEIRSLGGLFVLGTERHDARRIDNQLRGRAGRQGDPGVTEFYVSLDDDLMRIFGSDRIKKVMDTLGVADDEPIQNKMITRGLEKAQEKIEGFHFDGRRTTLDYDNVLNTQRKSVYNRRRALLEAKREEMDIFLEELYNQIPEGPKVVEQKKKVASEDLFYQTLQNIILYSNDILWIEHLETMDYTRSSVNLRAYGQRDPLIEYKKEGLRLFKELEVALYHNVFELIERMDKNIQNTEESPQREAPKIATPEAKVAQNIVSNSQAGETYKAGRNDPCPCGSGKKFKKCHGK